MFRRLILLVSIVFVGYIGVKISSFLQVPPLPKVERAWWGYGAEKEDTTIKPFKITFPRQVRSISLIYFLFVLLLAIYFHLYSTFSPPEYVKMTLIPEILYKWRINVDNMTCNEESCFSNSVTSKDCLQKRFGGFRIQFSWFRKQYSWRI